MRSTQLKPAMDGPCGKIEQLHWNQRDALVQRLQLYWELKLISPKTLSVLIGQGDDQNHGLGHRLLDFDRFLLPSLKSRSLYAQSICTSREPDIGAAVCVCGHIVRRSSRLICRSDSICRNARPSLIEDAHRKDDGRRPLRNAYRCSDRKHECPNTSMSHAGNVRIANGPIQVAQSRIKSWR